jgi:Carboxypeptidase regulatory-like domain
MKAFVLAGLAMLVPAGAPVAAAADTSGSLAGQVRDASGRPVSGAIVCVSSPAQVVQTTSDASGRYCFIGLVPETYALVVEKNGYAHAMYVGIRIAAGKQSVVNAVLNERWIIEGIVHHDFAALVDSRQTADAYPIDRWNSLIDVRVLGGSAYPR